MMNKEALREKYLKRRQALSDAEIELQSQKICQVFFEQISLEKVKNIHLFLPIAHHKEVDTWFIIRKLETDFPDIGIVVSSTDWKNKKMDHFHLRPDTELQESKLGIPELVNAPNCPAEKIDMVLMPLLAFDQRGQRVGYGAGFYDRFLQSCLPATQKIGLSFFGPTEEVISDVHEHDIPLDACLTPEKVYKFS